MTPRRLFLFIASVTLGFSGFVSSPARAYLNCPDKMWPSPTVTAHDRQQDRNGNQVVCRHLDPGNLEDPIKGGGPDDVQDDVI